MKTSDNTTYKVEDVFDARYLNVLKLHKINDADIALAEIMHQITIIKTDLASQFGDDNWKRAAGFALRDFEHKARLVAIRRDALLAEKQAKKDTDTGNPFFKAFHTVAKKMLPANIYKEYCDSIKA